MQIRNFFISETTKNKELNKSRLSYRKKVSKNNPLKIYSKKIMSNYQSFGLNYFDNSKIGIGYGNYIKDNRFKGLLDTLMSIFTHYSIFIYTHTITYCIYRIVFPTYYHSLPPYTTRVIPYRRFLHTISPYIIHYE